MPDRVLPVSTSPPTDLATLFDSEIAEYQEAPAPRPTAPHRSEGEELERKEKLKTKWAQLEAIVGADKRLELLAVDMVEHFGKRLEALEGKAMIVCMSRRICVELYSKIVALRPGWHSDADEAGAIKVVMTGSASDPADWQPHIRNQPRREALANRFRDPGEPLKVVLVRDMWLTGQAGEGDADSPRAGRGAVGGMGGAVTGAPIG